MTPHIAGGTSSTIERRLRVTARNVDRFVRGEPLVNVIAELSGAGPALASV
jgi:phosphoglycerate dehydrogenase-like enzyme